MDVRTFAYLPLPQRPRDAIIGNNDIGSAIRKDSFFELFLLKVNAVSA
jgi:hypothetical protein